MLIRLIRIYTPQNKKEETPNLAGGCLLLSAFGLVGLRRGESGLASGQLLLGVRDLGGGGVALGLDGVLERVAEGQQIGHGAASERLGEVHLATLTLPLLEGVGAGVDGIQPRLDFRLLRGGAGGRRLVEPRLPLVGLHRHDLGGDARDALGALAGRCRILRHVGIHPFGVCPLCYEYLTTSPVSRQQISVTFFSALLAGLRLVSLPCRPLSYSV